MKYQVPNMYMLEYLNIENALYKFIIILIIIVKCSPNAFIKYIRKVSTILNEKGEK